MTENDSFYKEILDNLYDGVYFVDLDRNITYWNKGAERITGFKSDEVIGRSCRDNILNHCNKEGDLLCLTDCPLSATMSDGNHRDADVFLHHADGHRVPVMVRAAPLRNTEGNIFGAVEVFSSDTGVMSVRQQLQDMRQASRTDQLTNVNSRQYVEQRLRGIIAEYADQEGGAAVVFMDIDHFKQFNDSYGHDVGDQVLRVVATTLKNNLRKSDTVGRWGGEEFVAILDGVPSPEIARLVCEKLRALVEASHVISGDNNLKVTISVGATLLLPNDTPESIVQRADALMYQSKQSGRNQVSIG